MLVIGTLFMGVLGPGASGLVSGAGLADEGEATEESRLVASDPGADDDFGNAVDIDGNTGIVAARHADHSGLPGAGAAYVYEERNGSWEQAAKLTEGGDAHSSNRFGADAAVDGDRAVVGAPDGPQNNDVGVAYFFERTSQGWVREDRIVAPHASSAPNFGKTVDLDGDTAAVGADKRLGGGHVHIFTHSAGGWTDQTTLTGSDVNSGDDFGKVLAIEGDTLVVSAPNDGHSGATEAGSAYVFRRSSTGVWTEEAKLVAPDAAPRDQFGNQRHGVAIDGDTVAVGATSDDHSGHQDAGSVYVFTRSNGNWDFQTKVTAPEPAPQDGFGRVSLEDGVLAVTMPGEDHSDTDDVGAVLVYEGSGADWTFRGQFVASEPQAGAALGTSGRLSGAQVLAGASDEDHSGFQDAGAAYVFDLEELRPSTLVPVDAVLVDAADPDGATSHVPLVTGQDYVLEARGTYRFGSDPSWQADAECFTFGGGAWDDTAPAGGDPDGLDLLVNGNALRWRPLPGTEFSASPACSSEHSYRVSLSGAGSPAQLQVKDSFHPDNEGRLLVVVYARLVAPVVAPS